MTEIVGFFSLRPNFSQENINSSTEYHQFLRKSGDIPEPTGNFTFARGVCQSQGADLASVHSAKQNSWFFSHLGGMGYWLGANKIKRKIPVSWLDGTQFDFMSWQKGEPRNEYEDDGDCMK